MPAQAVYISTYIFYIIALALGALYYRRVTKNAQKGLVRTESMHAADFAGIALIIGWYSLGLFAPPPEKITTIDPRTLGIGMISQFIPCGLVLMILSLRGVDTSKLFNIRWKRFYLIFAIAPVGVLVAYAFSIGLVALGYETWLTNNFGNDAGQQEAIAIYQATDAFWVRGMMAVMVVLIAPLTEEIIFRGYIYPATKKFTNPVFATLMTSIIFGVAHLNISALLPLVFLAIIFTIAYELTGSIWAPISIHTLFNASTIFQLEFMKSINP